MRISPAESTLGANIPVQPLVGDQACVGAFAIAVVEIAADARPGSGIVVLTVGTARLNDVLNGWKLAPDPGPRVVLIGDRADADTRGQARHLFRGVRRLEV